MLTVTVHTVAGIPTVVTTTLDGTDYAAEVQDYPGCPGRGVIEALTRLGLAPIGGLAPTRVVSGFPIAVQWTAEGYTRHHPGTWLAA